MDDPLLFDAWCEGELTAAQAAEVAARLADPRIGPRWLAERRLVVALGAPPPRDLARRVFTLVDGRRPSRRLRLAARVRERLRRHPRRGWARVAAAALAVVLGGLLLRSGAGPAATFTPVGAATHPVRAGDELSAATGGEVAFADGTRLALAAGTRFRIDAGAESGTRLRLESGSVRGEIAAQPPGRPFTFVTAEAEVTVLGTGLDVSRSAARTRVELRHGQALVSQDQVRHHLRGRGAVVGDAAGLFPACFPVRIDFEAGAPAGTWGVVETRADAAGQCLGGRTHPRWAPDDLLVHVPLAADEADAPGWEAGTAVAFALRLEGEPCAPKLQVFNATRRSNFILRLPRLEPGRWHAIRQDLRALTPVAGGAGWARGDRIAGVFIVGPPPGPDARLLLDDLALIPPP